MARIQHLAIASLDPDKQAEFYKKVFGFEEVRRLDNPRARGVVLTDGHINISVLQFQQDQIDHGLDFTGLHHFGVYVEDLDGTAKKLADEFFGKFAAMVGGPPPPAAAEVAEPASAGVVSPPSPPPAAAQRGYRHWLVIGVGAAVLIVIFLVSR